MYISGHLHTDEKYTRTLPNDAIVTEGTKSFIFILDNEAIGEHGRDESEQAGHDEDDKSQLDEENHKGHAHGDNDDNDGGVEADGVEDFSVETVVAAASVVDDDLVEPVDSERFEDNLL